MSEIIKKNDTPIITKATIRRIVDDIKSLIKEPLHDIGIFYQHDEEDMLKGHAMIIGPEETCYEHGFYFFKFAFPHNYPVSPPKVEYLTNDGVTRFHPNLYRDGKVCLSVLNTWRGEGWSSCQSIRSILIILLSILTDAPLLHEPGITKMHSDFQNYNKIITFRNYEFAVLGQSSLKYMQTKHKWIEIFKSHMVEYLEKNKYKIRDRIIFQNELIKTKLTLTTGVYHLNARIDYEVLIKRWTEIQKIPIKDKPESDKLIKDSPSKDKPTAYSGPKRTRKPAKNKPINIILNMKKKKSETDSNIA
jgi:ubiquitin-protein ligase